MSRLEFGLILVGCVGVGAALQQCRHSVVQELKTERMSLRSEDLAEMARQIRAPIDNCRMPFQQCGVAEIIVRDVGGR